MPTMNPIKLTAARARDLFFYDTETGIFTRRIAVRGSGRVGSVVGWTGGKKGYLMAEIDGMRYSMHRIVWLYVYGAWPNSQIDHIDAVRTNNALFNLRDVPPEQNNQNRRSPYRNSKTGVMGVTARGNRFRAQVSVNGKKKSLGIFANVELAYAAYVQAKRLHHPGCTI